MIGLGLSLTLSRGTGEPPEDAAPNISAVTISPSSGVVGQTFTATISGTGYPSSGKTYQWELDGTPIGGATSPSYTTIAAGALTCVGSWDNGVGSPASLESGAAEVFGAPVASAGTWNVTEGVGTATYEAADRFTVAGDLDLSSMTGFTFVLLPGGIVFVDGVFADDPPVFESGGGSGYLTINEITGQVTLDETLSGLLDAVDFTVRGTNPAGSADATVTLTVAVAAASITATAVVGGIQFDSDSPMTITAVEGGFQVETA